MEKMAVGREIKIQNYGAIIFAVFIAVIGALMMTITSGPQMKGAAFLWLPAALQLIAGVWFGPTRGFLAGGLGAYAAGIIAYGGWGLVDIIMNPIAGGLANSMLPALLFRSFKINPDFGGEPKDILRASLRLLLLLIIVIFFGFLPIIVNVGKWAYVIALFVLIAGIPILMAKLKINKRDFTIAGFVCVISCLVSALIGSSGVVVSGQTWKAALIGTGLGWFLGDTVSCFLGLYALAYYTRRARNIGLSSI
jgi:MFS family permease